MSFDNSCCCFFRLSNLFHGLEEKSPLKADVYLSMLRLAKEADLAQVVVTDLEQVSHIKLGYCIGPGNGIYKKKKGGISFFSQLVSEDNIKY